ncbi:MAG: ribose transport system substrate-binding protein [Pseudonocardiales bacterium]|jgi:ABC-type sugar transport system substrate-binding protein|nr:ribose transport system substrate-binding protein [Pseudonocardiales bacterium]
MNDIDEVRRRVARTNRRRLAGTVAGAAAIALVLGACSSSGSGGGGGSATKAAGSSAAGDGGSADGATVQKMVDKAFLTHVEVSSLPAIVQKAFQVAAGTQTQAQLDTALKCWQAATCDTGTGGTTTLGIADGFGDNTWRKISKMEIILQALQYKKIGKITYTNAHGDLSQMNANIRSLTAQGVKAIVTYDDFGSAVLPAYSAAQRAGAKVSAFVGGIPNAPTSAVSNQVHEDICTAGKEMATTATKLLGGKGQVAFFNGTPGNPQGATWNTCAETQFKSGGGGVDVAYKADTNWTPAGTFKAASGLVSTGKPIKAILYDYADPLPQVVKAYEQAGKVTPALITFTSNNDLFGVWEKAQGTSKAFDLYYTSGLNYQARVSVTAVMELLDGKSVPAQSIVPMPFVKATKGIYAPSLPGTYPGSSVLIPTSLLTKMLS